MSIMEGKAKIDATLDYEQFSPSLSPEGNDISVDFTYGYSNSLFIFVQHKNISLRNVLVTPQLNQKTIEFKKKELNNLSKFFTFIF